MKKEIYIADSITELDKLAQRDISTVKPDKLYRSAEKLFHTGLQVQNEGDEEKSYILFLRFVLIYKFLCATYGDNRHYTEQRLKREYNTASEQLKYLQNSLNSRYQNRTKDEIITSINFETPKPEIISESAHLFTFPTGYINCNELQELIKRSEDVVILDTRPVEHFLQSSMKNPSCVNIPEEIILSGSSANILGKLVPQESVSQWNRRWKASVTVLLDWSSTKDTLAGSKLNVLKDILMLWDTSMDDNKPPIILNGGYLEWLQMYPMLCTNPDVVHEVQNSVLNDLLDLDSIEYPTAVETTPAKYLKPSSSQPVINRATKPVVTKDTTSKRTKENVSLDDLRTIRKLEAEEGMRIELQQREEKLLEDNAALEKSKQELNDENEQLRKKLQKEIRNVPKPVEPTDKKDKGSTNDVRDKLLQDAREKKPLASPNIRQKYEQVKRLRVHGKDCGLTGLVNLGSTCYMNSILQCYSNTRKLHNFLINSVRNDGIKPEPEKMGDIADELRAVIFRLWSGTEKYLSPAKLKSVIDRYGPRFKGREQQDAHEFMLSLNAWLHDELKSDMKRPLQVIWTPRQKNWVSATEGKTSIILETFCGQQVNTISCKECNKKRERFELFENLILTLPSRGHCTLENCLNQFYSKQQIHDYSCQTCKSNQVVSMEMKVVGHPPVLVLCLKRFNESLMNGRSTFVKNVAAVKYPLENLNLFGATYNLYGVIIHRTSGLTLNSGHYFAIVKNLWNNKWYKYDDQYVTEVNKNEAIQPSDAYILFYQSVGEEQNSKADFKV